MEGSRFLFCLKAPPHAHRTAAAKEVGVACGGRCACWDLKSSGQFGVETVLPPCKLHAPQVWPVGLLSFSLFLFLSFVSRSLWLSFFLWLSLSRSLSLSVIQEPRISACACCASERKHTPDSRVNPKVPKPYTHTLIKNLTKPLSSPPSIKFSRKRPYYAPKHYGVPGRCQRSPRLACHAPGAEDVDLPGGGPEIAKQKRVETCQI